MFLFFLFFCNAPKITVTGYLDALLQQEIALVFLVRFRCGLQRFFRDEKPFPVKGTDLEIAARWRYRTCRNARENYQSQRKWVQSLCAPLIPQPFTPCIVDVHPYKNISLYRYRVPQ